MFNYWKGDKFGFFVVLKEIKLNLVLFGNWYKMFFSF